MADLRKTVDIILNGQDRATSQLRQVQQSVGSLKSGLGGLAKGAGTAAAALGALGAAITGLISAGLKEAYQQAVDLDSALTDLAKVMGDHPEKIEEAKQAAIELSNKYGTASSEITNSIADWVQAGYELEEAVTLTKDSMDTMISSEMNAAEATDALKKTVKGFNLDVEETRSKLDAVNKIQNNYAASTKDLFEALSRVAPIAKQMGFSVEEMAAKMTPAIEKFQNGRKIGTAFKTLLANLTDPTGKAAEGLETLGLKQKIVNGEFNNGKEVFEAVVQKFSELDEQQKAVIARQIAGKEHFAKFLGAVNDTQKSVEVYNTAMDSTGSMLKEVRNQLDSSENIMKVHAETWKNLATVVGDQFKDSVDEAIEGSSALAASLQDAVQNGAMEGFFDDIRTVLEALGEELNEVADALPEAMESVNWDTLGDSVTNVGEAFSGLFDDLDLSKPDDLAEAMQRIIDSSSNLMDFFANLVEIMGPIVSKIMDIVDGFNQFYESVRVVGNYLDAGFTQALRGVIEGLQMFWEAANMIPGLDFSGQIEQLEDYSQTLKERVSKNLQEADDAAKNMRDHIDEIPDKKEVDVKESGTRHVQKAINDIKEKKETRVDVDDKGSADKTGQELDKNIPKEKKTEVEAELKKKEMEVEASVDKKRLEKELTEIEQEAETKRETFKYTALVKTAQAESSMEKFKSAIESTSSAIGEQTDALESMMGTYASVEDPIKEMHIENTMDKQMELQKKMTNAQIRLIEQRIAAMKAQQSQMESGEGLITIQGEGLEPELEAFMWKILEKVQVRANEQSAEFLLGVEGGL